MNNCLLDALHKGELFAGRPLVCVVPSFPKTVIFRWLVRAIGPGADVA
jgi:hypothetical protein